jgi:hypothetical protein
VTKRDDSETIPPIEENNKSKEETPLIDELKEETRVVQDIEQGEDIEEKDNLEE